MEGLSSRAAPEALRSSEENGGVGAGVGRDGGCSEGREMREEGWGGETAGKLQPWNHRMVFHLAFPEELQAFGLTSSGPRCPSL